MNRIYRIVFNRTLGVPQVVSELASAPGGVVVGAADQLPKLGTKSRLLAVAVGLALATVTVPTWAQTCTQTLGVLTASCTGSAGSNGGRARYGSGGSPAAAGSGTGASSTTPGAGGAFGGSGGLGKSGIHTPFANGGGGGTYGGGGSGGGGAGGNGGNPGIVTSGTLSTTGGVVINGGAGTNGVPYGPAGGPVWSVGGGGGGGGAGVNTATSNASLTNAGTIAGGNGGNGAYSVYTGGGGGGGVGLGIVGAGNQVSNSGSLVGGRGGDAGAVAFGGIRNTGAGGGGGAGLGITGNGNSVTNTASIAGGQGGTGSSVGIGGVGVGISGNNNVLATSGHISGGLNGAGTNVNDAVLITGNNNTLELDQGYSFTGNVVSTAGNRNLIALGGSTGGSFNIAGFGAFTGFDGYAKNGTGTWTLTGSSTAVMPWALNAGTLSVSSDANLGDPSGSLTFTGGTLQFGSSFNLASTRAITLAVAGTIDTNGYATTISQAITGNLNLGLTVMDSAGGGALTLTGANTYGGDTAINAGAKLILSGAGSIASSNTVTVNGALDVSANGASIKSLMGSGSVALGAQALTLTNAGSAFAGVISDTGGSTTGTGGSLVLNGGAEALQGANTYTGSTTINGGTLQLLSSGSIASSSGVNVASGATLDLTQTNVASIHSLSGAGNLALGSNTQLWLSGPDSVFDGVISGGANNIVALFNGSETLNGVNTYGGQTKVNNTGTLLVGDASHTGASLASTVDVIWGGILGGHGSVGGVTLESGGILTLGGAGIAGDTALGMFTVNGNFIANGPSTTSSGSSTLNLAFGAPGASFQSAGSSDSILVNGNLTLNGATLNVINAGSMGPGLYNVITYTGTLAQSGAGLSLGNTPTGQNVALQLLTAQKQINLIDSTGYALNYWNANGQASATQMGGDSGTWSTASSTNGASTSNWTNATASVPNGVWVQDGFAVFGGTAGTVTASGTVNATGLQFAVDGYTVTGGTLVLDATTSGGTTTAPIIRVGDGSSASAGMTATISSQLSGSDGFTKTDAGTLVLASSNSIQGGVTVQGGTLQLGSASHGAVLRNTPISMSAGTNLVIDNGYVTSSAGSASSSSTSTGGAGGAGVTGTGFTVTNNTFTNGNVSSRNRIGGGNGGYSQYTNGGAGGSGISGTGFTANNAGFISGGRGGITHSLTGVGGAGGAGIDGSAFKLTNASTGKIAGLIGGIITGGYGGWNNGEGTVAGAIGSTGGAGVMVEA
ncbi:beta strand repeat-containing protein [Dyella choica]|uniref:beta strand repeat-containing protein n=1 Tax=Dyella choica TaxID=1927959 RepID=UPI0013152D3D|nr:ESPR domain-containing protein [Dyella choica]